ncbi:glycosyltransferase [Marinobacter sp.]|uniref:glycosyltransferase n=1 Tax=Marinobacter sp. TaxID=50741 RepID=UPI003299AF36
MLGKLRQQAVVAVSTQLEKKLELLFPGKVHKIFNFIDVDDIRRQWAGKRNLSYENPKIGIIGRLVPVKRVDLFIQTIALLNQNGLECTGVIIGDGPLQQLLTNYAKTLGVTDRIKFMGFMNPSMEALSELDLLLMTSDHEGLPMTLLEALALEIPVVAHNTGGIPEVLDNGHCGWLVDRHEAEGYADIILEILTPSLQNRSEKAEAGLNHLLQVFELEKNICKYIALYQQ